MGHVGGKLPAHGVLPGVLHLQLLHLLLDLPVLAADAPHQGPQLLIDLPVVGVLQVDGPQRLGDLPGKPGRQQKGQQHGQHHRRQNGGKQVQHQGAQGIQAGRDPQHRAVLQPQGIVGGSLAQGVGIAAGAAAAGFQRLPDLFPVGVAGQSVQTRGVKEHRPVRTDPGDPDAVHIAPQAVQKIRPAAVHGGGQGPGLGLQRGGLLACKIAVDGAHRAGHAHQKHRHGRQEDVFEDGSPQRSSPPIL